MRHASYDERIARSASNFNVMIESPERVGKPAMRALVVEDDRKIAAFVVAGPRQAGFAVDHVGNAEAGFTNHFGDVWSLVPIGLAVVAAFPSDVCTRWCLVERGFSR